ncbi:hypothetical protein [Methanococcoides seepicolus]|uniref:Uncharacterized protein n=1 Tax=Methanococcoides seepicolus TaxID=2828780 RepID=A0A9E5DDP0_9EURY|nr:hypothetical protein [Methanococcoides seepicolus]MCM1987744.1 hypothetical protein [Methanococcoides seepicolus]
MNEIRNGIKNAQKTLSNMQKKYDKYADYSNSKLNRLEGELDRLILDQFFEYDSQKFEDYILSANRTIGIIENIALIETAHRILVTIKYDIESFLYFKDLKKILRTSELELNDLGEEVSLENSKEAIENRCLRLKNIVTELQNINLELLEEKRNNSNSLVLKAAIWAIPVLIGIYQLIAMESFNFNPIYPLFAYVGLLVVIYLFLKINNPRYYVKHVVSNLFSLKYWAIGIGVIVSLSIIPNYPNVDLLGGLYDFVTFMSIVLVVYLISSADNARSKFIRDNREYYINDIKTVFNDDESFYAVDYEWEV